LVNLEVQTAIVDPEDVGVGHGSQRDKALDQIEIALTSQGAHVVVMEADGRRQFGHARPKSNQKGIFQGRKS
jgi:hypothetical protein